MAIHVGRDKATLVRGDYRPAELYAGVAPVPLVDRVEIPVATQLGDGDPSPDNIRPFVGVDEVVVPTDQGDQVVRLPHTSYGGYVDTADMTYVETHCKEIMDISRFSGWNATNNSQGGYFLYFLKFPSIVGTIVCDRLATVSPDKLGINTFARRSLTNILFLLTENECGNNALARLYLQNNPISFLYKTQSNRVFQLSPLLAAKVKVAGYHTENHALPIGETVSVPDTYNDTVEITAHGIATQRQWAATEPVTGQTVQLDLDPGHPIDVRVDITATQEGDGEPSTDNVRPISGVDSVDVVVDGVRHTIALPDTSYGGYIDWARRKYVRTHSLYTIPKGTWIGVSGDNIYAHADDKNKYVPGFYPSDKVPSVRLVANPMGVDQLRFLPQNLSSLADGQQWISTYGPINVLLGLITPIEYDLDTLPELIASPDGTTIIYTDTHGCTITANGAAAPSPYHQVPMVGSNGRIESHGKNLVDVKAMTPGGWNWSNGQWNMVYGIKTTDYIAVKSDTTYTYKTTCSKAQGVSPCSAWIFYKNQDGEESTMAGIPENGRLHNNFIAGRVEEPIAIITTPPDCHYIRISTRFVRDDSKVQLQEGNTFTGFAPYYPFSAPIDLPLLRAIPGTAIRDEIRPVDGKSGWYDVIHNVAVYEINGEERYNIAGRGGSVYSNDFGAKVGSGKTQCLCTHYKNTNIVTDMWFGYTDCECITGSPYFGGTGAKSFAIRDSRFANNIEKYKQFFKAQYAAGTPIVCWYAASNPTTERVYLGDMVSIPMLTMIRGCITIEYVPAVAEQAVSGRAICGVDQATTVEVDQATDGTNYPLVSASVKVSD